MRARCRRRSPSGGPRSPPPLADLVMRLLAKHPAGRPASAAAVLVELEALLTPAGGTSVPHDRRPSRAPAVALALGLALLAALAAVWLRWDASGARPRPGRSRAVRGAGPRSRPLAGGRGGHPLPRPGRRRATPHGLADGRDPALARARRGWSCPGARPANRGRRGGARSVDAQWHRLGTAQGHAGGCRRRATVGRGGAAGDHRPPGLAAGIAHSQLLRSSGGPSGRGGAAGVDQCPAAPGAQGLPPRRAVLSAHVVGFRRRPVRSRHRAGQRVRSGILPHGPGGRLELGAVQTLPVERGVCAPGGAAQSRADDEGQSAPALRSLRHAARPLRSEVLRPVPAGPERAGGGEPALSRRSRGLVHAGGVPRSPPPDRRGPGRAAGRLRPRHRAGLGIRPGLQAHDRVRPAAG